MEALPQMTERALRAFGDLISLKFTKNREHSEHHYPGGGCRVDPPDKLTRSAPFLRAALIVPGTSLSQSVFPENIFIAAHIVYTL